MVLNKTVHMTCRCCLLTELSTADLLHPQELFLYLVSVDAQKEDCRPLSAIYGATSYKSCLHLVLGGLPRQDHLQSSYPVF